MKKSFPKGFVFVLCYIAYVSIYAARLNLSMASPGMIAEGWLTSEQYGFLGSAFFVTYACGRLLNGVIGDRVAPWIMVGVGLTMTGAANLFIGVIPVYLLILCMWCVNAYAQSMLWSSLLRCMTGLYGKELADRKVPVLVSSVSVGNIVGIVVSTWLVEYVSLEAAFVVPGAMCAVLGLTSAYVLSAVPQADKPARQSLPFKMFFKDKQIRTLLVPALFHGVIKDNIGTWMALYFVGRFAIDLESSAWFVLLIPAVGLVGRLVYPLCYKFSRRREHMISFFCFGACVVLAGILCLDPDAPLLAAICLSLIYALISMINTSMLSMFPLRFAAKNMVSSVSGIADFATYLGAGIGSAVYGFLNADGNFIPMFLSWVILAVASMGLLVFLSPFKKAE